MRNPQLKRKGEAGELDMVIWVGQAFAGRASPAQTGTEPKKYGLKYPGPSTVDSNSCQMLVSLPGLLGRLAWLVQVVLLSF